MAIDVEHEQAADPDELQDLQPGLMGRLGQGLRERLAPLPEEAWVSRQPIQDQADPQATQTSDRVDDDGSLYDPSATAASTGSTSKAAADFRKGTAKVYGMLAGAFAAAAGGIVNWRLKADDQDTTWLMTQEEAEDIGQPVGRILARRAPLPVGEGDTNDVIDGLGAALATVGYVMRCLMERADRKRGPQAPNLLQQTEQTA